MITQVNSEAPTAVLNVEYAISRQPEPYNNVRAAISLPVFVNPSDDIEEQIIEAFDQARSYVQDEIDRQFESFDRPAPYSPEDRFKVLTMGRGENYTAIVPQEIVVKMLPNNWSEAGVLTEGHRLSYLFEKHPGAFDCSTRDYSNLPLLHNYKFAYNTNDRVRLVLLFSSQSDFTNERYEYLRQHYPGTFYSTNSGWCTEEEGLAKLNELLMDKGVEMTIIDLRDGDWSKLPPPPEPEISPYATELEYLRYFFNKSDFGPADSDVRKELADTFEVATGKLVPDDYREEEDHDDDWDEDEDEDEL